MSVAEEWLDYEEHFGTQRLQLSFSSLFNLIVHHSDNALLMGVCVCVFLCVQTRILMVYLELLIVFILTLTLFINWPCPTRPSRGSLVPSEGDGSLS